MDKTVKDVMDALNDEQKNALASLLSTMENDDSVKHSDEEGKEDEYIDCDEFMHAAFSNAQRDGSLREAVISHAATYGINDIEELFPDHKLLTKEPVFVTQEVEWIDSVLQGVNKLPFSRVKQLFMDDSAVDGNGYEKGSEKYEEVMEASTRVIEPTTVYIKSKLDRDDVIDITDFDAVSFMRKVLKKKLDELLAKCMLVGDGRDAFDSSKVDEECIIPIAKDVSTMNVRVDLAESAVADADAFIDAMIINRPKYKGSGSPVLFIKEAALMAMLVAKDANGLRLYKSVEELKGLLQVSKIVPITGAFDADITLPNSDKYNVDAILVNPKDYSVGIGAGGKTTMFDDFDIDYNQQKFLIETRLSGGLTKLYSALTFGKVI